MSADECQHESADECQHMSQGNDRGAPPDDQFAFVRARVAGSRARAQWRAYDGLWQPIHTAQVMGSQSKGLPKPRGAFEPPHQEDRMAREPFLSRLASQRAHVSTVQGPQMALMESAVNLTPHQERQQEPRAGWTSAEREAERRQRAARISLRASSYMTLAGIASHNQHTRHG